MHNTKLKHEKAMVSSKGQVVIPKSIRDALGIHAGMELMFEMQANQHSVSIKPVQRTITQLFGCCKSKSNEAALSVSEMDEAIGQAVLDNDKRGRSK